MIRWDTCKEDFRCDGSLRDIYVSPATLADWQVLYPLLRDYPGAEYSIDGVIELLPAAVEQVFALRPSASPMLRFRVGRIPVIFHFFSEEEIECDLDPREITAQTDLDALLGFVRQMGDTTRKSVAVTPENVRQQAFITYDPDSREFEYHAIRV